MGKMPLFPDALVNAVLGYGVVFVGLILLMAVVIVMGKALSAKKAAPAKTLEASAAPSGPAAKDGPVAPGSAGQIMLHDVPDRDAAMVMAIVANKLQKPLNELRFKSIKEVK